MNNNLPIKIDNKTEISIAKKRNLNRIKEQLKRIGITGIDIAVGISFGLLPWALGSTIANPAIGSIVSTIGMTTIIGATYETFINGFHKRNKDMMFVTRKKLNGEIYITQDILYDLKFLNKLKDYNATNKAGIMGLQCLVRASKI